MLHRIRPKQRLLFAAIAVVLIGTGTFVAYKIKKSKRPMSAPPVSTTFKKKDFDSKNVIFSIHNDFETTTARGISADKAVSGTKSLKFTMSNEFSPSIVKPLAELKNYTEVRQIKIEIKSWARGDLGQAQCLFNIENKEGISVYKTDKPIVPGKAFEWGTQSFVFDIEEKLLSADYFFKFQLWNKSLREFYVDDMEVTFLGAAGVNSFLRSNFLFDFESPDSVFNTQAGFIKQGTAHSGKTSFDLSNGEEYGPIVTRQFGDVGDLPSKKISISLWVYPLTENASVELAVSLFDKNDKGYFWMGKTISAPLLPKDQWTKVNASIDLPAEGPVLNDVVQVLARNKGKTKLLFDDLEIVYDPMKQRLGNSSTIDPNLFYQKQFVGEKNKPPFPTFLLTKVELKNNTGTSIAPGAELTSNDLLLPGDFYADKNGFDELLCIQKGAQQLYSYSVEEQQFKILWQNSNSTDSIWNSSNEFYSGDFNADKKFDILLYNPKTKNWGLINFDGKTWKVIEQGNNPPFNWIVRPESATNEVIAAEDILYPWRKTNTASLLLKLNTSTRFDLKLIEQTGASFTILGNIDFKGYSADHNPKYYEQVTLVSGRFISKEKYSLLVVACNCADKNHKGANCSLFEQIPALPNSASLYELKDE